jgi:hypothetical protein
MTDNQILPITVLPGPFVKIDMDCFRVSDPSIATIRRDETSGRIYLCPTGKNFGPITVFYEIDAPAHGKVKLPKIICHAAVETASRPELKLGPPLKAGRKAGQKGKAKK